MTDEDELEPRPDDLRAGEFVTEAGQRSTYAPGGEDAEQAQWLSRELDGKVRYNYATRAWHAWDGLIWAPDKTKDVQERVYRLARQRLNLLAGARMGEKQRTEAMKIVRRLREQSRCESALAVLATMKGYKTDGSDWDQNPYLLGCANGIVDLRDGSLQTQPSPDSLVSKSTRINYVPGAPAERFRKFLEEITSGDAEMAQFLVMWFGYSLFGMTQEQRFLIMTGIGRNGKGALAHVTHHVFGDYDSKASSSLYMKTKWGSARSSEPREDLMKLKGKRLAIMSEPEGGRFNEEMLKAHTGGDPIVARPLYGAEITWLPTHSVTFLTNKPPAVDDIGPSMAARVLVAEFRERYEDDREDKTLYDKLVAEAEGVLALYVAGAVAWWRNRETGGLNDFIPERVRRASEAYINANDPLGRAIHEAFVIDRDVKAHGKDLYDAYVEWHARSDETNDPMTPTAFGLALVARGFNKKRGASGIVYTYIRPKTAFELADANDPDQA